MREVAEILESIERDQCAMRGEISDLRHDIVDLRADVRRVDEQWSAIASARAAKSAGLISSIIAGVSLCLAALIAAAM